jgi:hypothetical protein
VLMHNGFMPLNIATALLRKSRLGSRRLFYFSASVFPLSTFASLIHAPASSPVQACRPSEREGF